MSAFAPLLELEKACCALSTENRQYVLAVAQALKFAQEGQGKRAPENAPPQAPTPADDSS